jgi:glycosyltransferase involved in cell wall biosynthesis
MLAMNLTAHDTPVDIITTCAVDHHTWRNALPEGESTDGPLRVRRFAVGPRDHGTFERLHSTIDRRGSVPYDAQVEWMANSVWSPGALRAARDYERVVVMPYLFGTSFWQEVADPDRTIVAPCLHDEPHAHQALVLDGLCSARGLMMNSAGEKALLDRMLERRARGAPTPRREPQIVGCGFDDDPVPTPEAVRAFTARHGIEPGYILYAGRREPGKGVADLYRHYATYLRTSPDPRPLALMGSGPLGPPPEVANHVVDLGFVSPQERSAAYAGASVLVQPSRLESFGMVLFEAWLAGTPVSVNEESDVLRSHCEASGGGLWFRDAATFSEGVQMIVESAELRDRLATAGREYALGDFGWPQVRRRFIDALEAWG